MSDTRTLPRAEYDRITPAWAKAVILARLEEDESDLMTDYHGSRTTKTVVIGWSTHTKDLFAEMRKAAATFPPTAGLGPGLDRYTPRVVFVSDVPNENGSAYWSGSYSPWHRELDYNAGGDYGPHHFNTLAEAEAFVRTQGEPEPVLCSGSGVLATFRWDIEKDSIEHREKYSMGHGYYLAGLGGRYSGWQVTKGNGAYMLQGDQITVSANLVRG